jgi:hypothetical protein
MHVLRAIRPLRLIRHRPESCLFTTFPSESKPWFIDPEETPSISARRPVPSYLPELPHELPADIPESIRVLYDKLSSSPFLEPSTLVARAPPQIPPGPPLPNHKPKGRRRTRGGTYAGESTLEVSGGIWNWVVMAQVCELVQF